MLLVEIARKHIRSNHGIFFNAGFNHHRSAFWDSGCNRWFFERFVEPTKPHTETVKSPVEISNSLKIIALRKELDKMNFIRRKDS